MAALGLTMSATAQVRAQQTEGEREEAGQDEINRIETVMVNIVKRGKDLKLRHANPREILEYCQETLPKLDEMFRVEMMNVPLELQLGFQREYVENRQSLLNLLVSAHLALSIPSSTPSAGQ